MKEVNYRQIAEKVTSALKEDFAKLGKEVKLGVLVMEPDFATEKFIAIKRKRADSIGVRLAERRLEMSASTQDMLDELRTLSSECDGVIVQLPLPPHIDTQKVIEAISVEKDVDGIGENPNALLSPVVRAMEKIQQETGFPIKDKHAVVVGEGRLVGTPAARWLEEEGASVDVIRDSANFLPARLLKADIIVLGTGVPGILKPEMIKEGSVVLDAGTSEAGGKLAGDADPSCAEKASIFTPVPGGIGPIAVVMIFQNLLTLVRGKEA